MKKAGNRVAECFALQKCVLEIIIDWTSVKTYMEGHRVSEFSYHLIDTN